MASDTVSGKILKWAVSCFNLFKMAQITLRGSLEIILVNLVNRTPFTNFLPANYFYNHIACVIIAIPSSVINPKSHNYNSLQHSNLQ